MSAALTVCCVTGLSGAGLARANPVGPCNPCAVILFAGQSNMIVPTTLNVAPPAGGAYDATFTGSIASSPLPAATLRIGAVPTYGPKTTTLSPSAKSGTLTVTALTSGHVYAGQILTCSGCAPNTVITSDQFGGGATFGAGAYVVTPAQTIPPGTTFSAKEPDIAGRSAQCMIWSIKDKTWEIYAPGSNSATDGTKAWGPEGAFCLNWAADHPGGKLFMVKYAVGGQSLCPSPTGMWSPYTETSNYLSANTQMTTALGALPAYLGQGGSYQVEGFVWVQGERDGDLENLYCNDPVVYQTNLVALVNAFSKPAAAHVTLVGSIDDGSGGPGDVLTVTQVAGGPLAPGQFVLVPGQNPKVRPYIDHQLTGAPGGAGTYALQVYADLEASSVADVTSGASLTAATSGDVLAVTAMSGGTIRVGDMLGGPGVPPGATVAAFGTGNGTPGKGGVGWYTLNVPLKVASMALKAGASGWGVGADKARFAYAMSRNYAPSEGVQTAQAALSNAGVASLSMTAVNMYDARQNANSPTHNDPTWLAELGRRLYLAWKADTQRTGGCDLTTPTC